MFRNKLRHAPAGMIKAKRSEAAQHFGFGKETEPVAHLLAVAFAPAVQRYHLACIPQHQAVEKYKNKNIQPEVKAVEHFPEAAYLHAGLTVIRPNRGLKLLQQR